MTGLVASAVRPRVHFTPSGGWMNDPHGLTYDGRRYHVFFQYAPHSLQWQRECHWGHATSTDLLHWEQQPVALAPGDGDVGCWSGALVVGGDGAPLMYYTSVREPDLSIGLVRVARTADPGWLNWTKGEVVAAAGRPGTSVFRDPQVFRDGDCWRMLVGFGAADGTAGVEVFRSGDLLEWDYDGLLTSREPSRTDPWTGEAWECPQLLVPNAADGAAVLLVSVWADHATHQVAAAVGDYADGRLDVRSWQPVTAGEGHYAASAFTDAQGRGCVIFWIRGIGDQKQWAGALSIPYLVGTSGDRVRLTPHPAVTAARVADESPGLTLDVEWTPGDTGRLRLVDTQTTYATAQLADGRLTVTTPGADPVTVGHGSGPVRLIVDAQVLEVVTGDGLVGLPVAAHNGLRPVADPTDPFTGATLTWWHLT